jgi:hypothetical protein
MPRCPPSSRDQGLEQLHDDELFAAGFFEAVDRCDAWMVERRQQLGFALKPDGPFGIGVQSIWQRLDCGVPIQAGVAGAIDFAHAPGADQADDFIRAEPSSSDQRHQRSLWRASAVMSARIRQIRCPVQNPLNRPSRTAIHDRVHQESTPIPRDIEDIPLDGHLSERHLEQTLRRYEIESSGGAVDGDHHQLIRGRDEIQLLAVAPPSWPRATIGRHLPFAASWCHSLNPYLWPAVIVYVIRHPATIR